MTDAYRFDESSTEQAIAYAKIYAGENYSPAMETVLKVAFSEKRNLPTFRLKSSDTILLSGYMKKWVGAYLAGYNNRPSVRTGNCSGTHPDPMAKTILRTRIPGLEDNLADKIVAGHSLLMTIENNIGELLEEYLSVKLSPLGWYCCWGSTIDAVDFCKADGSLLQIKTSDNSENSSSSRVRQGTPIGKWFRRFSRRPGVYNWESLNRMLGRPGYMSEPDFRSFAEKTIAANPACIYIAATHLLNRP
ncbi:SinI family restriction endonuclease [uncultured Alistipes sp.]|jgi:hypothetical protein|uniref:SinI family restriction endonuclease n=1 Tax=uncultured Alistipes sp. TaxID=538949 RepID=UPI002591F039|nr:SinI family restriction endonuclease [uncultured Alistipes sp.]